MPNLSKQFVAMMQRNKHQCLIRIEGMHNFLKDDNQFDELLQSGYTVQLDLQQLASKEKKTFWSDLTKNVPLTHLKRNPFNYRATEDQFGQLHEEYHSSWLDIAGNIWAYCANFWYKQAYITDDNAFYVFRTHDQPNLIMLKYIGNDKKNLTKPTQETKNIISCQFFKSPLTALSSNLLSHSAEEYHKIALERDHLYKLKQSTWAVIISLLIWLTFQYPPSTAFFIGLLASIGIPFFPINLMLLATVSLTSIFAAIAINYLCDLLSSNGKDIIELQAINKLLYQAAFFIVPLCLLISSTMMCLQINLLILAFIALAFALYHYLCLNETFLNHKEKVSSYVDGLFKGSKNNEQHSEINSKEIELTQTN